MPDLDWAQIAVVRALGRRGGMMRVVNLLTELAPGTGAVEGVRTAVQKLKLLGLVTGPHAEEIAYRLTAAGWKVLRTLPSGH